MNKANTISSLFHLEFSKIVAVITRLFGLEHIEMAEDIVSDTFLHATECWNKDGLPENPKAWLYLVAKQKTLQQLRRNKIFDQKVIPEMLKLPDTAECRRLIFQKKTLKTASCK